MSAFKASSGDTTYNKALKNLSYYINFIDRTFQQTMSYKMNLVTIWANLKSIQRKMPDINKLCARFDLKSGLSRLGAWKLFQNALTAYLRTMGAGLLGIYDAEDFVPTLPQYLSSEIQV